MEIKKDIFKLISRVMGFRTLQFNGSHIYLWNVPMIMLPMKTFSHIQNKLIEKYGYSEISSIMYWLGTMQGRNGTNILLKKYNIKPDFSDLGYFYEQTQMIGLGKIQSYNLSNERQMQEKHYFVRNLNSPFAISFKEEFGVQHLPVDHYLRGLMAGAATALYGGEDLIAIETECIAKGDESCAFEAQERNKWDLTKTGKNVNFPVEIKEIKEIGDKASLQKLLQPAKSVLKNPETDLSLFLKRAYKNEIFKFSEGQVHIMGVSGFITPIDIIALFYYTLRKKYGKDIDAIFYEGGRLQGLTDGAKMADKIQTPNISIRMQRLLEMIGLYGLGKIEIIKLDLEKNNVLLKVIEGQIAKEYVALFGNKNETIDCFVAGVIAGLIEAGTQKKITIAEKSCIVQGNEYCIFETKK